MEGFVLNWLDRIIGHKVDWGQFGGIKGHGITNYLIDLVNFVMFNQDLKNPQQS